MKEQNAKWLWAFVALNCLGFALVLNPGADAGWLDHTWQRLISKGGIGAALIPLATMVLTDLIPPLWKARLIFLRWRQPLPGSRAFSHLAERDPRVDLARVRASAGGSLPRAPEKQNALWYRLYKRHAEQPGVVEAHRAFLLNRDLTALGLLNILGFGGSSWIFGAGAQAISVYLLILAMLLVATMFAARNCGVRFVLNVLAEESAANP